MIVFIIIFGTYTNLYMFKVMDWRMLVATAANVWSGMAIGFLLAMSFGKPLEDLIAIAIETGVQNTGVSIVVLGLSLQQPDADLASAVPVAASLMTPIPLTVAYLVIKIRNCLGRGQNSTILHGADSLEQEKDQYKPVANGNINGNQSFQSNLTIVSGIDGNEKDDEGELYSSSAVVRASNSNLIANRA